MSISDNSNKSNRDDQSFIGAVDQFLDELGERANREADGRAVFYEFLLSRLRLITESMRASIVVSGPSGDILTAFKSDSERGGGNRIPGLSGVLGAQQIIETGDAEKAASFERDGVRFFVKHIFSDDENVKALVLVRLSDDSESMQHVYGDLVGAVAGFASEFEKSISIASQQQRYQRLGCYIELMKNCNRSLSSKEIGFHLANDTRALVEADRVWVFAAHGRLRLLACSSVAAVDSRSSISKQMGKIVAEAVKNGRSYVFSADEIDQVPRSYPALRGYLKESQCQGVYVFLQRAEDRKQPVSVLITECFEAHDRIQTTAVLNKVSVSAANSLSNSSLWERIPFRKTIAGVATVLDQFRSKALPRTVAVLTVVVLVVLSLFFVQSDFNIQVNGQLRPVIERNVFSPVDGVVDSVVVEYGDLVDATSVLAVMTSPDYQLKLKQLEGRLETLKKDLESKQLSLLGASRVQSRDDAYTRKLAAEIEQTKIAIELANGDIGYYLDLTEELKIRSPISGQVFTRDLQQQLANRPVNRGDRLVSIADTAGDWHLVFDVSDNDLGYIEQSRGLVQADGFEVECQINSDVDSEFTSRLVEIEKFNSIDERGQSFVRAYAPFENESNRNDLRIGQTVTGNIKCGRRSLFFIWTRDVRDFLRSTFLWN